MAKKNNLIMTKKFNFAKNVISQAQTVKQSPRFKRLSTDQESGFISGSKGQSLETLNGFLMSQERPITSPAKLTKN